MSDESTIERAPKVDGYINRIQLGGKTYGIKACVVEAYPITCTKCGGSFELHHGEGECPYCHTHFTTMYRVVETD